MKTKHPKTKPRHIAFAKRLDDAMTNSKIFTVAELHRRILQKRPDRPIAEQTCYKWKHGDTMPIAPNMSVLADVLNVDANWLEYGWLDQSADQFIVRDEPPLEGAVKWDGNTDTYVVTVKRRELQAVTVRFVE